MNIPPLAKIESRLLDRHPQLINKLSSQFDKKRIKASDPGIIQDHFNKLLQDAKEKKWQQKASNQGRKPTQPSSRPTCNKSRKRKAVSFITISESD